MAPATPGQVREFRWPVRNPHGLHARPAAVLVAGLAGLDAVVELMNASTGRGPVNARSVNKVASLGLRRGDELLARSWGPQADDAVARLEAMAADTFGDRSEFDEPAQQMAEGTGLQVVLAPAVVVDGEVDTSGYEPGPTEAVRLREALGQVADTLQARADESAGAIFAAQRALLTDPELGPAMRRALTSTRSATEAVRTVFTSVAADFDSLPHPYLRERSQDVRSLSRQVLRALVGQPDGDLEVVDQPHVLVVDELDAATAATLDPALCLGVVTLTGGATGHGVIVATGRGVPVLTGRAEAADLTNGDLIGFDPVSQELWLRPDEATVEQICRTATARADDERRAAEDSHEPAVTVSAVQVLVEANISSLADAQRAALAGADGAGLVRTELLWGHRADAPAVQSMADDLVAIGEALGGRTITVRTWDGAADKPLPFLPEPEPELNPFLGERGLRAMRRAPELFRDQLRGIVLASQRTPVRVMFPMVTEPEEVVWARSVLDEVTSEVGADSVPVGIMVEVPAVALRIAEFAPLVDFVSVGTNDLTQYTCAVDRGNAHVASLGRADSPAVLALIGMTCEGLPGVPVAVCGDLASDTDHTATLVGLGVTELSVRPPLVGLVKAAVRGATLI
ncbi:putative PEP-binding protein [Aestuariimicrobium ganziense]|uniref:putative PEP-binding protein n=1 Tax=Aestuariimicrobium ganziense TaxID=2773677 RepID=UPI002E2D354F|nr:putative PEP-binding protein [Aestuariimicrobium ganziense]